MEYGRLAEQLNRMQLTYMKELCRLGDALFAEGEDAVLLSLLAMDRPLLSGEIVERTGLTSGRVANILKGLEAKRLIRRAQDQLDKRRVHVSLTEEGHARAQLRSAQTLTACRDMLAYLGEDDAEAAVRIIRKCLMYYGGK